MKRRTLLSTFALAPWCCLPRLVLAGEDHAAMPMQQGGIAISATFAPDGSLWVVGLNEHRRLFVQRSADAGQHWSAPRVLETGADVIAADGENRPKLRFGPNGWAVISYTQPLSKPYSGEIRMLRSDDGAMTFSAPFTVHQDRQVITHRFESIAFDSSGALHTLWIDKRDVERAGDAASYAGAAVYRNVSHDGGKTFGPDIKVADHSCECCRIALVDDGSGGLAAMWRHVFDEHIRDHAFATLARGSGESSRIVRCSFDDWRIDACPHHGPGLAAAASGGFHAVWFGVRDEEPAVRYARLDARGNPAADVRVIPDPGAEHADVCSVGDNVVIVWRSFDGQRTRYSAWISRDDGKTFDQQLLGQTDAQADNPLLVRRNNEVFALWRAGADIHAVRVLA
ncbi:MAG: exo-alpha-sialidase [Nevskiaceae bacterium]|jgi:hypothetical protein|nr:exo-alpha-sialidase [Nevskiaceae bacterium]